MPLSLLTSCIHLVQMSHSDCDMNQLTQSPSLGSISSTAMHDSYPNDTLLSLLGSISFEKDSARVINPPQNPLPVRLDLNAVLEDVLHMLDEDECDDEGGEDLEGSACTRH